MYIVQYSTHNTAKSHDATFKPIIIFSNKNKINKCTFIAALINIQEIEYGMNDTLNSY
jgi:hypothetical protein